MNCKEKNDVVLDGRLALDSYDIERLFGISRGTLANLRLKRRGAKFFRIGRRVYYKPQDFKKWFFSNPVLTKDSVDEA